ncbi:nucleotidyltransferase family protein [Microvirga rosea]|uniref:nucleotidyltransferase family protein n=1 Tax=Microvirga rosea TaxID=2715425 RepID=UPI001D0ACE41|nr:nucleotidyltransferase family protein [Microvirga rosea]MCB8823557.1 nucleotidyltransferase family protein [Microvirga rosea]
MPISVETFIRSVMENPINTTILNRLPLLRLNQCYLTAGCLFQTIWNQRSGLPPQARIKDYDVFYFEDDLSLEAEDAVIQQGKLLFDDLDAAVEFKNQARVHLWYEQRFGRCYPRLASARDGIDRYLIACTCVGINVATGKLYAPNGLEETWEGVLRINPLNPQPDLFLKKAEDYRARWPWLRIQP